MMHPVNTSLTQLLQLATGKDSGVIGSTQIQVLDIIVGYWVVGIEVEIKRSRVLVAVTMEAYLK